MIHFVSSREFRTNSTSIWALVESGQPVVITKHGKPLGVLIGTDDSNLSQFILELVRLKAKLAVSQMRTTAKQAGLDKSSEQETVELVKQIRRVKS